MEQLFQKLLDEKIYRNGTLHRGYRKSSNIQKNFPELYEEIINHTDFLPEDCSFGERFYCIEYNITERPKCLYCGSFVKYKDRKYHNFCSLKCSNNADSVKLKKEHANIEKFGVPFATQSKEIREKQKQTFQRNYGVDHPFQSPKIQESMKQNWIELYGVDNPRKDESIKSKIKKTKKERYGKESWAQQHISENTLEKLNDKDWLLYNHIELQKTLVELANELHVSDVTVGNYLTKYDIPTHHFQLSLAEKEITRFLNEHNINTINNSRDIISPKEIDIFLPDYSIAIEYCGLYWHSEDMGKDRSFHKNKLDMCSEKGIRLITIFEDEWIYKQDIVKNTLLHLTGNNNNKIYARKCTLKEINTTEKDSFLNQYHIQGTSRGTINLGLCHNKELVACMSFLKQKDYYILNRYATSINVVGGFSKLLKHFQLKYTWNRLVSFADLRWSEGDVYENNGWTLDAIIPPDYSYIVHNKRVHKFNYRHKHLSRRLDQYDPYISEWENCKNNNISRIWNCGMKRYVINN